LNAAQFPALEQQARHFLDEQWNSTTALGHAFDHIFGERVTRRFPPPFDKPVRA
jgi:hypothetical protein